MGNDIYNRVMQVNFYTTKPQFAVWSWEKLEYLSSAVTIATNLQGGPPRSGL